MLPILLFFILVFARISTCYDSRISKCKYITVKNNTLAKILIEKESFFDKGKYTLKKDRNKMSIVGLSFYLCLIFIVVLTLFFLFTAKNSLRTFWIWCDQDVFVRRYIESENTYNSFDNSIMFWICIFCSFTFSI